MTNHVLQVKRAFQDACGLSAITDADSGQQQTMLDALNAAIQSIATFAPLAWYGTEEFGAYLRAPQSISLTGLAAGAKTAVWADIGTNTWAYGCALRIGGDPTINRFRRTSTSYELLHPYTGAGSTANATIYNDVVEMPTDFLKLKGDLTLIGVCPIPVVATNDQLGPNKEDGSPQFIGQPTLARLVSRYNSGKARVPYLKFNALPSTAQRIALEYHSRPADVEAWADERYDLVPSQYVQSILIPIALAKLAELSTIVSESRLPSLQAGGQNAFQLLDSISDAENGNSRGVISTGQW